MGKMALLRSFVPASGEPCRKRSKQKARKGLYTTQCFTKDNKTHSHCAHHPPNQHTPTVAMRSASAGTALLACVLVVVVVIRCFLRSGVKFRSSSSRPHLTLPPCTGHHKPDYRHHQAMSGGGPVLKPSTLRAWYALSFLLLSCLPKIPFDLLSPPSLPPITGR